MSLTQQLELAAISEPAPVSQWPAVGWWLLGCLTILLSIAGIWYGIKYWRKHRRLKRSLHAIETIYQEIPDNTPTANICGRLNIVLKQHLIQAGLHQAGHLHGPPWREFLQQHTAAKYHDDIAAFVGQLYQPDRHEQASPTTSSTHGKHSYIHGKNSYTHGKNSNSNVKISKTNGTQSPAKQGRTSKPEPAAQWQRQVTAWLKALPC